MNNHDDELIKQAKLIITRLERISADSIWAHRSSGYRGALLRWIESFEEGKAAEHPSGLAEGQDWNQLAAILQDSFILLQKAARDVMR